MSVCRLMQPAENPTGVVAQHVDAGALRADLVRQGPHLVQVGEVGHEIGRVQFGCDGGGLAFGPSDHSEIRPRATQPACRSGADAVAGTGDDDGLAGHCLVLRRGS